MSGPFVLAWPARITLPAEAFVGTTNTDYNSTTDASGQAVFTLPQGNYRFRADQGGAQYWSDSAGTFRVLRARQQKWR